MRLPKTSRVVAVMLCCLAGCGDDDGGSASSGAGGSGGDGAGLNHCQFAASQGDGPDCSWTGTACRDKREYALVCSDGACTCSLDHETTKSFDGSDCGSSDQVEVGRLCGWNLE